MLRFEPNVRVGFFHSELGRVLEAAAWWSARSRIDVVVNSISDGTHRANSLHYFDLAVDLDTEGDQVGDLRNLHAYLARILDRAYDVLLEGDHVHVEWDVHR